MRLKGGIRAAKIEAEKPSDDPRAVMTRAVNIEATQSNEIVLEVFAGTPLATDSQRIRELLDTRSIIQENWARAKSAFLTIGRALLHLSETLSPEEFLALRRGSDRLFPFGDAMASKLRMIALAVERGRIAEVDCPPYTTAYLLASLGDDELQVARERGLVRANVRAADVLRLRAELRAPSETSLAGTDAPALDRIAFRRSALVAERARLVARLTEIELELSKLPAGAEER